MSKPYQALNIPPAANERGGIEVLRSAIIDGELHLTLRPLFDEPQRLGPHVRRVRAAGGARLRAAESGLPEADTVARISSAFETEIKTPPAVKSAIGPLG